MINLGFYQTMTTIARKVGGPRRLVTIIAVGGYGVIRTGEAGTKKVARAIKNRSAPCATKGQVFRATSDGEDSGLKIRAGDEYQVLERDGDAILIEVLGDPSSPYFVSSKFLRSVSDFPQDDAEGSE
jgi:hypothetical protein